MKRIILLLITLLVFTGSVVYAEIVRGINIEFVDVGNQGNHADPLTGFGAVDYQFRIGRYEVTAGQYTDFLNMVARSDPYGLYRTAMSTSDYGCKIERTGSAGNYSYSAPSDRVKRPVNIVSWYDAARFCNYLTSGNTEVGVYRFDSGGNFLDIDHSLKTANQPVFWIPSENEWYKAAYHKNDGITNHYYFFPTQSNTAPSNEIVNPDPGNNANMYENGYTIGNPYWMTEVGEFENSESPYGTFDQGGNVWEWNEALYGTDRGVSGGCYGYFYSSVYLESTYRGFTDPLALHYDMGNYIGFRIASNIPEPCTLLLLGLGGMLIRKR